MIEFTHDGPFAEKADPLFPGRVRIIGLGQTGTAVCDQLVLRGRPSQDLWVLDSDQQTVEGSIVPNRHLLGQSLVHGLGCSGDIELAREIVAMEEEQLASAGSGCDFLILALGLAGSTGVALAEHLIQMGHKAGAKVIVVGVQPFGFEGLSRREKSIRAIADLRRDADSVLVLSPDRITEDSHAMKDVRTGFHVMHQLLAQAAQALSQIVCKRGLIQLSFADVRSLYGRYSGSEVLENCWVAHVEGDIHDSVEDMVQQLFACPLLSDESIWKHVDHAIVAVNGTCDLGLSDVQQLVGVFKDRLPVNIPIATSASLDEETHEKVRMTVLLAMTGPGVVEKPAVEPQPVKKPRPVSDTVPLPGRPAKLKLEPTATEPAPAKPKMAPAPKAKPAPVPVEKYVPAPVEEEVLLEVESVATPTGPGRKSSGKRFVAKQEEMQFEAPTRGRFEKTHETMYNGENLDQPTFRRRRLAIKL